MILSGILFSFKNQNHSKLFLTKIHKMNRKVLMSEAELSRWKLKIQVGFPDLGNFGCTGDNPCGPCPGLCIVIERRKLTEYFSSSAPSGEVIGELTDDTHFKIIFNNSISPQIVNNSNISLSENIIIDGLICQEVCDKNSITAIAGMYTVIDNGDGTSFTIMNCLTY